MKRYDEKEMPNGAMALGKGSKADGTELGQLLVLVYAARTKLMAFHYSVSWPVSCFSFLPFLPIVPPSFSHSFS